MIKKNKLPPQFNSWEEFYFKYGPEFIKNKTKTLIIQYRQADHELEAYYIGLQFLKNRVLEELEKHFLDRENLNFLFEAVQDKRVLFNTIKERALKNFIFQLLILRRKNE